MTCRRCNSPRNVAHYFNDVFEGWFCATCVDQLCDSFVAGVMADVLARSVRMVREAVETQPTAAPSDPAHSRTTAPLANADLRPESPT